MVGCFTFMNMTITQIVRAWLLGVQHYTEGIPDLSSVAHVTPSSTHHLISDLEVFHTRLYLL